jgi:hypothetical protein
LSKRHREAANLPDIVNQNLGRKEILPLFEKANALSYVPSPAGPAPAPTRRSAIRSVALPILAPLLASGCSPALAGPARQDTPPSGPARLLLVTATAGYTHDSIPVARDVLTRLGQDSGAFEVTLLPDLPSLAGLTAQTLAAHDAVFFLNTSGELPLDGAQKGALLEFVAGGGGYLGAHAASDTFYAWPEYGDLVGAYFQEHPWTQAVRIVVEDETHPLTAGLGSGFSLTEEVYVFRSNPRPRAHVLLRLDPASVNASGSGSGSGSMDFPLAWCAPYGQGRSFYTALGHFDEVWQDALVQRHLLNAVLWTTRRIETG